MQSFAKYKLPIDNQNRFLCKGLFENTLPKYHGNISFAHIDCDWYESVSTCLDRIVPRLIPGGVLVLDDYDHWSGCRRAVDDFFDRRQEEFSFNHRQRLHIIRRS